MFHLFVWRSFAALACLLYAASSTPAAVQRPDCSSADPNGIIDNLIRNAKPVDDSGSDIVTGVTDFELTVDPQDPYGRILLATNLRDTSSDVIVARLDGQSGTITDPKELVTIAKNYYGYSAFNGPEWFQKPNGQLGILYPGKDGVRAVFRPAVPEPGSTGWSKFIFDVNGAVVPYLAPPTLRNTSPGAYPTSSPPPNISVYSQFFGSCPTECVGYLDATAVTDIGTEFWEHVVPPLVATFGPPHPNRDGYILASACGSRGIPCGVFEAKLNYDGGFASGSVKKLASTNSRASAMTAGRHPVTGDTLIFVLDRESGKMIVRALRQPAAGGTATEIGKTTVPDDARHFRVVNDNVQTVFLYQSAASAPGTYVIPIKVSGASLVMGATNHLSTISSSEEIVWLPTVNKWAFYYNYESVEPVVFAGLTRCWFVP